jgi:hypothetical protein
MTSRTLDPPLLDNANAAFIQGGVSINASSRTKENKPVMAKGAGCRVSKDLRTITLLFQTSGAEAFIEGIKTSRQIAVVFSLPSSNQTIQLKGSDASVAAVQKQDTTIAERYCDAFVADVCPLGYHESLVRALLWFEPGSLTAISFTPSEAFLQTPGPRAGECLKSGANAHSR